MPDPSMTLHAAGRELWDRIVSKYDLRPDELDTLEDVCQVQDTMAALQSAWVDEGSPMHTKGSMGQLVIHPLIGELRAQRMSKNALWRQLKLPDDEAGAPSNQQRAAANSKWATGRGRGA